MNDHRASRIGELAAAAGVNPRTIRFYERVGLLPEPRRTAAGYRVYDVADAERLSFILKAKAMGLSLDEIRDILGVRDGGSAPCSHVRALIRQKIDQVQARIASLQQMERELRALHEEAERSELPEGCFCGIIERYTSPGPPGRP